MIGRPSARFERDHSQHSALRQAVQFESADDQARTEFSLDATNSQILKACNAVIALSQKGYAKTLWSDRHSKIKPVLVQVADERAQANMIAQQILNARNQGVALKDQAVLFRDARHSAQLELELTRRRVPFRKFVGFKFLEATHIKIPSASYGGARTPGSFGGREGTAVAAGHWVFSGHQNARLARW
jgi:UvrD-like helicase family protein